MLFTCTRSFLGNNVASKFTEHLVKMSRVKVKVEQAQHSTHRSVGRYEFVLKTLRFFVFALLREGVQFTRLASQHVPQGAHTPDTTCVNTEKFFGPKKL